MMATEHKCRFEAFDTVHAYNSTTRLIRTYTLSPRAALHTDVFIPRAQDFRP